MKTHKHYWRKFLNSDETGGFVHCPCGDVRFLDSKQFKKFMKLIKSGIKGNEISLSPKKKKRPSLKKEEGNESGI